MVNCTAASKSIGRALRFEKPDPSAELVLGQRSAECTLAEGLDKLPAALCICGGTGKDPTPRSSAVDRVLTETHGGGFVSRDANVRRAERQCVVLERALQDRVAWLLRKRGKVAAQEVTHGVVVLDICEASHRS